MGILSEYLFVVSGTLGITFFIYWLVVPAVYGIPLIIYWTFRRYLHWRTLFVYSHKPGLCLAGLILTATLLNYFIRQQVIAVAANFWFASGVAIGILLWIARITIFQSVRSEIHNQLTDDIKAYVTPKGRLALLALLSRW